MLKSKTTYDPTKGKRLTVQQINSRQFADLCYAMQQGAIGEASFLHRATILGNYWHHLALFYLCDKSGSGGLKRTAYPHH